MAARPHAPFYALTMFEPQRGAGNPGCDATDDELRALAVVGYHAPQQLRSIETTRRLLAAAWDEMAAHPAESLRLEEVLAASGTSASSFYSRFDSVRALVEFSGLVAEAVEERHRASGSPLGTSLAWEPGAPAIAVATAHTFAPIVVPGQLPREVLAAGMWSDAYVTARARGRSTCLQVLAMRTVNDTPDDDDPQLYARVLTWLHLASAVADQAWASAGGVLPASRLQDLATTTALLSEVLFCPSPSSTRRSRTMVGELPVSLPRPPISSHSDRGARAIAELREATHQGLVQHGRDLSPGEIARSVHRSRSAFFDAFGTLGTALADLARAEQVGRIPTELFRPRPEIGPNELVPHVVRRVRAWQDHHGITGRRLLQAAPDHPELAVELIRQMLDSVELLASWYAPMFELPPMLTRLVFLAILASEQHHVVWGARPDVVVGPDAVGALLAPVMADAASARSTT